MWSRCILVRCPPTNRMPSTSMVPDDGSSRKLMHRSNVLLPDPDRPKMTTTSPLCTSMLMPFRTSRCPKDLWTS